MRVLRIEQNSEEWLEARKGKISGSKLKDIVVKRGNGRKIGFYQLIADRLETPHEDEDAMERGHRLESEAIDELEKRTKLKFERDCGVWVSDISNDIIVSPDGCTEDYKVAAEAKCLGGARHLQAVLEDKVPSDFYEQVVQYFIVNEQLEKLYMVFHNPNITADKLRTGVVEVLRSDVDGDIEFLREYETRTLKEINSIIEKYAF